MFKRFRESWAAAQEQKREYKHFKRFLSFLGYLSDKGDLSISIVGNECAVSVWTTVGDNRVRLCETKANNLEYALYEAICAIQDQGHSAIDTLTK